jgi:hypothetical protein
MLPTTPLERLVAYPAVKLVAVPVRPVPGPTNSTLAVMVVPPIVVEERAFVVNVEAVDPVRSETTVDIS